MKGYINRVRLSKALKAKVKRLARRNGMTETELIRCSIKAKLHECESSCGSIKRRLYL